MTVRSTSLALLAAAAALHGCSCDQVPKDAVTTCDMSQVVQGAVKTDILFVIDDSGSMTEEQTNLVDNISAFLNVLQTSPVANDFQIGVTTTSVSDFSCNANASWAKGALVGSPAVMTGADADLVGELTARVGPGTVVDTSGSGKEQPLRAMRLALSEPLLSGANAGFLRSGSRLAVIFLSDEDDNSETCPANEADTNAKTHNDAGDGVDYKFTREDPVGDYVAFLRGPIGGEGRDVVVAAIAGFDATTKAPTCGYDGSLANRWCCGSVTSGGASINDTCTANVCGSNTITYPTTPPNLTMDTYCCGEATGTACTSTCATAYDKADRFEAFLASFPGKSLAASVCDASFASTLEQIAGLIISPTVPLEGAPADYRMLVVQLKKAATGNTVPCTVGIAAGAQAVYVPPSGDAPATLTFEVAAPGDGDVCKLDRGDQILIHVVCAG